MTLVLVASVLGAVASAAHYVRGRLLEREGCPRCRGRLARGARGLACSACELHWTHDGRRLGHGERDEQMPPARLLRRE